MRAATKPPNPLPSHTELLFSTWITCTSERPTCRMLDTGTGSREQAVRRHSRQAIRRTLNQTFRSRLSSSSIPTWMERSVVKVRSSEERAIIREGKWVGWNLNKNTSRLHVRRGILCKHHRTSSFIHINYTRSNEG